jgi:hypothetical protein
MYIWSLSMCVVDVCTASWTHLGREMRGAGYERVGIVSRAGVWAAMLGLLGLLDLLGCRGNGKLRPFTQWMDSASRQNKMSRKGLVKPNRNQVTEARATR